MTSEFLKSMYFGHFFPVDTDNTVLIYFDDINILTSLSFDTKLKCHYISIGNNMKVEQES